MAFRLSRAQDNDLSFSHLSKPSLVAASNIVIGPLCEPWAQKVEVYNKLSSITDYIRSKLVQAVAPLTFIRRCPVRMSAGTLTILTEIFRGFPRSLRTNIRQYF